MPLKTKTSLIIDEFLKGLALSSVAAMTVIAPNSLIALEKPLKKVLKNLDKSVDSRKLAYYTKRLAVVDIIERNDGVFELSVNAKGKKRAVRASFENLSIPRPRTWDHRWRLVVFDIPEEFVASRHFLSDKLKSMNFYMLQRSLWVHPFPCLEQIALIKHIIPQLAPHVVLVETESIDAHNHLVDHFKSILPL